MKTLIILILIFINISAEDREMNKIRNEVLTALNNNNENQLIEAKRKLEDLVEKKYTSVRASYLGSATSKMAQYSFFPWTKISYTKSGSKLLNKAIKEKPENIAIRFNRFFTYINFPDFLKKNHLLQQDARWFLKNLKNKNIKHESYEMVYQVLSMFFIKRGDKKRYIKYLEGIKDERIRAKVKKFKLEIE